MSEQEGRRVEPVERDGRLWLPAPEYGDYCCYKGEWWVVPPKALLREVMMARGVREDVGPTWGALDGHDVEEHDDGTITVSPSIASTEQGPVFDGYLRRGRWTTVGGGS